MTAKFELAKEITARFHGAAAADRAEDNFRSRSQKRETPADIADPRRNDRRSDDFASRACSSRLAWRRARRPRIA